MGGASGKEKLEKAGYTDIIEVREISGVVLGRQLVLRCGNEGTHSSLNIMGQKTLRMLRAAISFVPDAKMSGTDLTNAIFLFNQPGRSFAIVSGDGDWEYAFFEENGNIKSKCSRMPWKEYIYNAARAVWKFVKTVAPLAIAAGVAAIPGMAPAAVPFIYGVASTISGEVGRRALTED